MLVDILLLQIRRGIGKHQCKRQQATLVDFGEFFHIICGLTQFIVHVVIRQEEHRFGVDLEIAVLHTATALVFVFRCDFAIGFYSEQCVKLVHHSRCALLFRLCLIFVFFGVVFLDAFLLFLQFSRAIIIAFASCHIAHAAFALTSGKQTGFEVGIFLEHGIVVGYCLIVLTGFGI